jgi:hypothetical protein
VALAVPLPYAASLGVVVCAASVVLRKRVPSLALLEIPV